MCTLKLNEVFYASIKDEKRYNPEVSDTTMMTIAVVFARTKRIFVRRKNKKFD